MCGRYTLAVDIDELAERFECTTADQDLKPRYNVAPTQFIPVVAEIKGVHQMQIMHWGLVPFWAKDRSIGNKLINARIETICEIFLQQFSSSQPAFQNGPGDGHRQDILLGLPHRYGYIRSCHISR